jgi:hypothetical protein
MLFFLSPICNEMSTMKECVVEMTQDGGRLEWRVPRVPSIGKELEAGQECSPQARLQMLWWLKTGQ